MDLNIEWNRKQIAYMTIVVHVPFIVVTNSIVIITIVLLRKTLTPDYYVIGFLAVTDLLIGLVNIPCRVITVLFPDFFSDSHINCVFRDTPVVFLFTLALSMLMLLNMDRFVSICFPFWYTAHMTNRKIVVFAILLLVMDASIYIVIFGYFVYHKPLVNGCHPEGDSHLDMVSAPWFRYTSIILIFSKYIITIICTGKIAFALKKSIKHIRGSINLRHFHAMKSKSKITVVLTSLYVVLWTPNLVITGLAGKNKNITDDIIVVSWHLMVLNSSVNAVVYSLITDTFHRSFKYILTTPPCTWKNLPHVIARQRWSQTMSSRDMSHHTTTSHRTTSTSKHSSGCCSRTSPDHSRRMSSMAIDNKAVSPVISKELGNVGVRGVVQVNIKPRQEVV